MSDLIKREDAIETLAELWLTEASADSPYVTEDDIDKWKDLARELFCDIPSAEPKTWRWVMKTKEINDCDGHRAYYWYECDNCGARPPKDQWGHEWHSDFCPNCGAMMEGGEEE